MSSWWLWGALIGAVASIWIVRRRKRRAKSDIIEFPDETLVPLRLIAAELPPISVQDQVELGKLGFRRGGYFGLGGGYSGTIPLGVGEMEAVLRVNSEGGWFMVCKNVPYQVQQYMCPMKEKDWYTFYVYMSQVITSPFDAIDIARRISTGALLRWVSESEETYQYEQDDDV